MSWSDEGPAKLGGPLARRLENELRLAGREQWQLAWQDFELGMGEFLRALEAPSKNCDSQSSMWACGLLEVERNAARELRLTYQGERGYLFEASLESYDQDSHKRLSIFLRSQDAGPTDRPILGLELFLRECLENQPVTAIQSGSIHRN